MTSLFCQRRSSVLTLVWNQQCDCLTDRHLLSSAESSQSAVGTAVMTGMCALPQEELSGQWITATLTHTHRNNTSAYQICCHFACAHTVKLKHTQWFNVDRVPCCFYSVLHYWVFPGDWYANTNTNTFKVLLCIHWTGLQLTLDLNNSSSRLSIFTVRIQKVFQD